jgi:hypothetical protein
MKQQRMPERDESVTLSRIAAVAKEHRPLRSPGSMWFLAD